MTRKEKSIKQIYRVQANRKNALGWRLAFSPAHKCISWYLENVSYVKTLEVYGILRDNLSESVLSIEMKQNHLGHCQHPSIVFGKKKKSPAMADRLSL